MCRPTKETISLKPRKVSALVGTLRSKPPSLSLLSSAVPLQRDGTEREQHQTSVDVRQYHQSES
jgi:hypothetical protein